MERLEKGGSNALEISRNKNDCLQALCPVKPKIVYVKVKHCFTDMVNTLGKLHFWSPNLAEFCKTKFYKKKCFSEYPEVHFGF